MSKTVFTNGRPLYSEWLNAMQNIQFDDLDFDGHYPRLTDDALTSAPGNIKNEWQTFRDAFLVTGGVGLAVNIKGGLITLLNGNRLAIADTSLILSNNTTNFVFITKLGTVANSTKLPLTSFPLATVVTSGGVITSITDTRYRYEVKPRGDIVKLFGGSGDEGAFVLNSGSATFDQSEYYFSSFDLGTLATLNVDRLVYIRVAGDVNISGTINVSTATLGGRLQIVATAGSEYGLLAGSGLGASSGQVPGLPYSYLAQPYGSGGTSGAIVAGGSTCGCTSQGGAGGGGIIIEAQGTITIASTGSIIARGGDAAIVTLVGTPQAATGGGGGSGGLVLLKSSTGVLLSPGSTADVRGGNGANSLGTGSVNGGAGGSGGRVVVISPVVTTSGANILLTGGLKGSPASGASGGGSGGSFGSQGGTTVAAGSPPTNTNGNAGVLTVRNFVPVG